MQLYKPKNKEAIRWVNTLQRLDYKLETANDRMRFIIVKKARYITGFGPESWVYLYDGETGEPIIDCKLVLFNHHFKPINT